MMRERARERGIALLTVIGIMVTMFGATASVIMVLSARSRAMTDTANETGAFYLAEAGIESSKYEIAQVVDSDGDGVGNISTTTADGNYTVEAKDLGNNTWQLTSTGSYGDHDMTLEAVVGQSKTTRFPSAAATFVGDFDTATFKFTNNSNVLIDGGNMPAFSVSSLDFFNEIGSELASDIAKGKLSADSIIGTSMTPFMPQGGTKKSVDATLPDGLKQYFQKELGIDATKKIEQGLKDQAITYADLEDKVPSYLMGDYNDWVSDILVASGAIELPVQLTEDYSPHLKELSDLYDGAVKMVYEEVIPNADVTLEINPDDVSKNGSESLVNETLVWGTEDEPVTVYLSKPLDLKHDVSISGYGTLVIDDKLRLYDGSVIDWKGDVIVLGNDKKTAELDVHGGDFLIDGNLMVLGAGDDDVNGKTQVKVSVDHDGYAKIDGSVLMSTSFGDSQQKQKAQLDVYQGQLDINGLFTMLGREVEMDFNKDSEVAINGMWQVAAPPLTEEEKKNKTEKVNLNVAGTLQITYDQQNVQEGVGELQDLGVAYELPDITSGIITEELNFYSWHKVSSTKNTSNQ